jgi:hypothetical protein
MQVHCNTPSILEQREYPSFELGDKSIVNSKPVMVQRNDKVIIIFHLEGFYSEL